MSRLPLPYDLTRSEDVVELLAGLLIDRIQRSTNSTRLSAITTATTIEASPGRFGAALAESLRKWSEAK